MRYYGAKSKLIDLISYGVQETGLNNESVFLDAFSGTSTVGVNFKSENYQIISNDNLQFCFAIANTKIGLNRIPSFNKLKGDPIKELNSLNGLEGFMSENYSPLGKKRRKYFSIENAKKIDAINVQIHNWQAEDLITSNEYFYLKTSLLESVNLISNVSGTYGAYLKTWDNRALKPLVLKDVSIYNNKKKNKVFNKDINKLTNKLKVDIAYLDPPYNSRQYSSNYFLLEVITRGWFKEPFEPKGKTGMVTFEDLKSDYSYKNKALPKLKDLIESLNTKYILLSYNNEGIISREEIYSLLKEKGKVKIIDKEHKRYRSINQDGSNIKTKEYLYVVKVS